MVLSQRKGEAHRKRKSDEVVPPVSNVGYTCALGPPYRVHRACPIYRLGPSSFRRSAFEAPKGAKNAASAMRFDIRVRYRGAKRYSGFTSELIYAHLPHGKAVRRYIYLLLPPPPA